jgi:hypothetical protein
VEELTHRIRLLLLENIAEIDFDVRDRIVERAGGDGGRLRVAGKDGNRPVVCTAERGEDSEEPCVLRISFAYSLW